MKQEHLLELLGYKAREAVTASLTFAMGMNAKIMALSEGEKTEKVYKAVRSAKFAIEAVEGLEATIADARTADAQDIEESFVLIEEALEKAVSAAEAAKVSRDAAFG